MKNIFSLLIIISLFSFGQTPCLDAVANSTGLIGEYVPQCEEDGSYSPMQCWSSTGYCWCVDENGEEIPGTSLGPGEGLPNCNEQEDSLNVLFIGNSYTASNNLTNIISSIATSMGDNLITESSLLGGATLQLHASNSNTNDLIMSGNWDYVVLQEQSQYPSFPLFQVEQDVFPYASQLNDLVSKLSKATDKDQIKIYKEQISAVGNILGILQDSPDKWLGIGQTSDSIDSSKIDSLIEERKLARESKDFSRADEIRNELAEMGIEIEDTPKGTIWRTK